MTQREENFVSMCRAVNDVFKRYESEWKSNKRFEKEVSVFGGLFEQLAQVKSDSNIVTTGATVDKADAALRLFTLAADLGKRVSVYAIDKDNQELHDRLRISRGALSNMRDTPALAKVNDMYNQLLPLIGELGDYGVSQENLDELKALKDEYDALISRPRSLIVERKGHNETIPELIAELRQSLYKLDSLINLFSGTAFGTDYKNARVIVDLVGRRKKKAEDKPSVEPE
ncbi:MAG: hypothetical protein Q4G63_02160 [Bacteroidia bacterium]|nr:hypothetical protein [Bacteroidia bacterium]